MKRKKKNTARVVDKSSVNYTFTNDVSVRIQANDQSNHRPAQKIKHITKISSKDLKNQNRYKTNSKSVKSMQGHSPVYE